MGGESAFYGKKRLRMKILRIVLAVAASTVIRLAADPAPAECVQAPDVCMTATCPGNDAVAANNLAGSAAALWRTVHAVRKPMGVVYSRPMINSSYGRRSEPHAGRSAARSWLLG